MKKLLLIVAIGFAVWQYYPKLSNSPVISNIGSDGSVLSSPVITDAFSNARSPSTALSASTASSYSCDGRTHCSQMRSCEEATYFLKNCPGTQMDGDYDGVPCESQWCQ
ncbi:excalibur calcium-binding domain-containing protein [Pseudomonas sp. SJZ079]|uniref:excalibur calcium-binding domain-containing protein n=1 Tax=Pseudomonas sp. SJZ079 TaxID=2572887 RepID=UPI0011BFC1EA|nr:excalibur calcium-binding domain-containing protein [Pseudomonas sp. SJZ079]